MIALPSIQKPPGHKAIWRNYLFIMSIFGITRIISYDTPI